MVRRKKSEYSATLAADEVDFVVFKTHAESTDYIGCRIRGPMPARYN